MNNINTISEKIINSAFKVSNELGSGFLEKVYENALVYQLRKDGLKTEQQKAYKILYDKIEVGNYYADLVVEDTIIVELKAVKSIENIHLAQIINFGNPKVEIKRVANNL